MRHTRILGLQTCCVCRQSMSKFTLSVAYLPVLCSTLDCHHFATSAILKQAVPVTEDALRACQHAFSNLPTFSATASHSHLQRQRPSCNAALLQVEGEGELVQAQNQKLHRELWQRQREALLRSQPEAAEAAAAAKEAAMTHMPSMTDHPAWIQQGQLYPHQLQVCCC